MRETDTRAGAHPMLGITLREIVGGPDAGAAAGAEHGMSGIRPPGSEAVVHRIAEIAWRYLPCEIVGAVTAVACGSLMFALTGSTVFGAIGATLGENLGYYAIAAITAWRCERPDAPDARVAAIHCVRSMIVEFGPAEIVDTLIARPVLMVAAATLMDSAPASWLVGKLLADVVFYAIVIGCWRWVETRRARHSPIGSGSPGPGGWSTTSRASSRVSAPGKL